MSASQSPQGNPSPRPSSTDTLRMGVWTYFTFRCAPKTQPARVVFEIGILALPLLILAILVKLAQG
jgi:hypothetical protein